MQEGKRRDEWEESEGMNVKLKTSSLSYVTETAGKAQRELKGGQKTGVKVKQTR